MTDDTQPIPPADQTNPSTEETTPVEMEAPAAEIQAEEPAPEAPLVEQSPEETLEENEEQESEESEENDMSDEDEEDEDAESKASVLDPHLKKTSLKTSIGKQAKNTGKNWYVIHTYSGYEDAVEKALRQRIESLNMHDLIFDVIVPKESTITIKKGEHVTEKKRLFPGYVLVEMIVTDESWYVVRNTPNVTGFVGSGTIPVPIRPEEFDVIQKHIKKEEPKFKINFSVGEQVIISDGPFKNYEGLIDTIDEKKGKLKVLVTIFGRETPVELDFVQVKKK